MMQALHTSRARAFTLLELLVASAIFSALIGAILSLLIGSIRLRETTFRAVEAGMPRAQIAQVLHRDIAGMVVPSGVLSGALAGEAEETSGLHEDTLSFFTTSGIIRDSELEPWGEIQQVEYYLAVPEDRDADMGLDFYREVTRNLLASTIEEEEDIAQWRMIRGVNSLVIEYWDGEQWADSWDSTTTENENPKVIRVYMDFVNDPQADHYEAPLTVVCEVAAEPRPAAESDASEDGADGDSGSGGGSAPSSSNGGGGGGGAGGGGGR